MKKLGLTLLMMIAFGNLFAQAPQKINYQAIVRNASGSSVTNQLCGVRVSILQGSTLGPEVFAETHGPTSNGYGLINLQIGTGTNTGPALSTIDWGANTYYIKIEIDPTGGTSYSVSSVAQLISVPYALYAKTAENVDDADADPTNEYNTGAVLNANLLEITDGGGTVTADLSALLVDPDMDPSNEIQTLSKVGQIVTLSDGGGAFTDDVNDADASPTNELNSTLTLVGTTLQLTDAGGTLNANLTSLVNDADANPANELNTGFTLVGTVLQLTDAGGTMTADLSSIGGGSDPSPTNELNTNVTLTGTTLNITDAGGTFSTNLSSLVNDADANPSNELQTISKVGNVVTLSNGGGSFTVDDSDASATNEFNTGANLTGTTLNITDGGGTFSVDLSSLVGGGDPSSTNELNTGVSLVGTTLNITDAGGTFSTNLSSLVNDADADATNELITNAILNGTDLEITDAAGIHIVDLSSLVGGGDPSSTNELITGAILNGTDLEITDAGGTTIVDLSSLVGGGDPSSTNELITGAVLNGTDLEITDAGGTTIVDLSSLSGGGSGPQYKIGQYFGGGVIIYVDSTGDHGIIASLTDLPATMWEPTGTGGTPYNADSYTDGETNTAEVYANYGTSSSYAARSAAEYNGGGFTDWYLPALFELEYLFNYAFLIGMDPTVYYWSSTETNNNGIQSKAINYVTKEIFNYNQSLTATVRPIRKF